MKTVTFLNKDYPDLERDGFYFQMTHGRRLMRTYHSHDFFEIIYIASGRCVQTLNDHPQALPVNTIQWLRPGDWHGFIEQDENTDLMSFSITVESMMRFSAAYNPELQQKLMASPDQLTYKLTLSQSIDFLSSLNSLYTCQNESERLLREKLLLGWCIQSLLGDNGMVYNDSIGRLTYALNQMTRQENIRDGIDALLRLSNFSHAQLNRLMKRHLNTTPQHYVIDIRMKLAYEYLINTDFCVEEIAYRVGYSSVSHFNTLFTQQYRMTPGAVRTQTRKERKYIPLI